MAEKHEEILFEDGSELTAESAWKLYTEAQEFNDKLNLDDTVKVNENMFIGKQWEGVTANNLPTTQLNIIKRTVMFKVATICSDSLKVVAGAPESSGEELIEPARIVSEQFDNLMEQNGIVRLMRRFTRDAAVRGDGCLYSYWDEDMQTGAKHGESFIRGGIETEVIQNTRVYFGDPNDNRVQKQPWIIIRSMLTLKEAQRRAKKNGGTGWEDIKSDEEDKAQDDAKKTDKRVTDLLLLWRDPESREIYGYEFTKNVVIREPFSLGIKRYPIVWLNWDYVQDSYHGQAEVTGMIPNQVAYNKMWAASVLSNMSYAFPKVVYDPTRIKSWSNQIGVAIKAPGGDVSNVAKVIQPEPVAPQVYQFMQGFVEQTQQSMGVTSVALGDTRPDNTSAIIALQRAAATPMELTKLDLYDAVEELFRIYLEFMAANYGKRTVYTQTPQKVQEAVEFAAETDPTLEVQGSIPVEFDFGTLKDVHMSLKLDVGASSYFSEIASMQTLDNLLKLKAVNVVQYLERVPAGYVKDKEALIQELKQEQARQMQMMQAQSAPESPQAAPGESEIPTGKGYSALQRKINQTGQTS